MSAAGANLIVDSISLLLSITRGDKLQVINITELNSSLTHANGNIKLLNF